MGAGDADLCIHRRSRAYHIELCSRKGRQERRGWGGVGALSGPCSLGRLAGAAAGCRPMQLEGMEQSWVPTFPCLRPSTVPVLLRPKLTRTCRAVVPGGVLLPRGLVKQLAE